MKFSLKRLRLNQGGYTDDGAELAELVMALDGWRKGGGFDPYGVKL